VLQQWRRSGKIKKRMKLKFFLNLTPVWANSGFWCLRFPYFIGSGTGTIALDPTFGSFTSLEPVSHEVNRVFWWKCSDCLDRNEVFWCSECVHNVEHLIYWQGQRVRDALLIPPLHATWMFLLHLPFMMPKLLLEKK